ncbi:MAG: hypothetical protein JNL66_23365 [Alphaproteobacteria bacterium]|nr:hypothetical protein [Alphaproteobacteria bacterium]
MASRSTALAFASLLAIVAPALAQQPVKAPPAGRAPAAAPAADAPAAFEREIDSACYRRIDRARFAQRLAQLRAAAGDDIAAAAPSAVLAAARIARESNDFAAALREYDALIAGLPAADTRREAVTRERAVAAEEQALVAGGAARPAGGWLLTTLHDAPGPAGAAWRVGVWARPDCSPFAFGDGESAIQLYRAAAAGAPLARVGEPAPGTSGMTLLVNEDAWGVDLAGDGRPLLAFDEANGGNCGACVRLRLYRAGPDGLAEMRVEAPQFVVPQMIETVAPGRRVLLGTDTRWAFFGGTCHACSPGVAVAFSWSGDRFTPSCRAEGDYFRRQAGELGQRPGDTAEERFGAVTSILLARTQAGEGEQAWKDYRNALAQLRRRPRTPRNAYAQAERQLAEAYRAGAAAMAAAACPVNALALGPPRRR